MVSFYLVSPLCGLLLPHFAVDLTSFERSLRGLSVPLRPMCTAVEGQQECGNSGTKGMKAGMFA